MESIEFLSSRSDLIWRKLKGVLSVVSQLHDVSIFDAHFPVGPITGHPTSWIDCRIMWANIVDTAMDRIESFISL